MLRRRGVSVAALVCACALVIGAGGIVSASARSRTPSDSHHDAVAGGATAAATVKFLLHAGITYYVFDHYIWQPYKAGDLHGFTHVVKIAEAGLAAVFIYHEAKLMITDVKGSSLLSFLAAPIAAVVTKLSSLKAAISGGNLAAVANANNQLGSLQSQASTKGVVIKEIVHAL